MLNNLDNIINRANGRGASDIHLIPEMPPLMRINGDLIKMEGKENIFLRADEISSLADGIITEEEKKLLMETGEIDLSFSSVKGVRLRVNVYLQKGETAIAMRIIPETIPEMKVLGVPGALKEMMRSKKGLILITGPAGSGKTTTLASMIDHINHERSYHIITIEDPIEYIHKNNRSIISQREVGADTRDFPGALRAALRQDPDVIMLGEMRDLETIATAITAAETGHLVMATLHTVDAAQTVDRIIDVFPPHQQNQIRVQLSNTLIGVVSQKLIKGKDGRQRFLASEVLYVNTAVRNLIREGKIHQIYSVMQTGGREGMSLMDASIKGLYEKDLIDFEAVLEHAALPDKFFVTT